MINKYNEWLENATLDEDLINELKEIKDNKEAIEERFYKELEFGTAGLRGIVGAGTNRMNKYTVGKATPEEGYEKADVFDKDGNTIKGYGGGNCQISSTLYNAVLELPNIEIIERHKHSKKVYYVEERQGCSCSLGQYRF